MAPVRRLLAAVALLSAFVGPGANPAAAQGEPPASRCLAVARSAPPELPVVYVVAQERLAPAPAEQAVTIRYVDHSTFIITSPDGVTIATDYAGWAGPGVIPRVVTMNRAHPSHYTDFPDPRIRHVLRGWAPDGPAEHSLTVGDVLIRNVTTDIRSPDGGRIPDGNSIFIFEVARLCIGHLGHLHHELDVEDLAWVGQLDVVMVPVDGYLTMNQASMAETLRILKARIVLPMHYFDRMTVSFFISRLGDEFDVEISPRPEITVSPTTLPPTPTVIVLR